MITASHKKGFPDGSLAKIQLANVEDAGSIIGAKKIPWRSKWQPPSVFLPGKFHGQRSQANYSSPWGPKASDTIEKLRPGSPQTSNPTTWPWRMSRDCPLKTTHVVKHHLGKKKGYARRSSGARWPGQTPGSRLLGYPTPLRAGGDWGPSGAQTPRICRLPRWPRGAWSNRGRLRPVATSPTPVSVTQSADSPFQVARKLLWVPPKSSKDLHR